MPRKKKDEVSDLVLEDATTQELSSALKRSGQAAVDAGVGMEQLIEACGPKCRCSERAEAAAVEIKPDPFIRNENGSVNWRKMIKSEYIVLNTQYKDVLEKATGKLFNEIDPESVDDKYKLILLAGIKEVAALRGFDSVDYDIVTATPDYVAVKCVIQWQPAEGDKHRFGPSLAALADAKGSSDAFVSRYMMATAENRSFIRAVRNYLRIHIVGKDEIDFNQRLEPATDKTISKASPLGAIIEKLKQSKRTFEQFTGWWVQFNEAAKNWKQPTDIPDEELWVILSKFNDIESKKGK
jgi:hypothetical protein